MTTNGHWNGGPHRSSLSTDDPRIPHGGVRFLVDDRVVVRLQPVGKRNRFTRPRGVRTVQELNAVRLGFQEQLDQLRRNRLGTAASIRATYEDRIPTDIRPAAESFGVQLQ